MTPVQLARLRQGVAEIHLPAKAGRSGVFGVRADDRPSVSFLVNSRGHCATELSFANSNREQPPQVTGRRTAGLVSAERRA